jgi:TolA-binding protein
MVDKMPDALRAGPYYVLAEAESAAGDAPRAALDYLRLPILYPRETALVPPALLAAGGCLEKSGDKDAAARIYRELVAAHRDTPEAAEAENRLRKDGGNR